MGYELEQLRAGGQDGVDSGKHAVNSEILSIVSGKSGADQTGKDVEAVGHHHHHGHRGGGGGSSGGGGTDSGGGSSGGGSDDSGSSDDDSLISRFNAKNMEKGTKSAAAGKDALKVGHHHHKKHGGGGGGSGGDDGSGGTGGGSDDGDDSFVAKDVKKAELSKEDECRKGWIQGEMNGSNDDVIKALYAGLPAKSSMDAEESKRFHDVTLHYASELWLRGVSKEQFMQKTGLMK